MKPLGLNPAQQRRLEKLAHSAGRSPRRMMQFVLRDGFEFCEWVVRESIAADADVKRRGAVPDAEVQRRAREIIAAAYAKRHRKAA